MTDDLIYCPNCKDFRPFQRIDKYVRIFELSKNDKVKMYVVECAECHYPIGAFQEQEYYETDD